MVLPTIEQEHPRTNDQSIVGDEADDLSEEYALCYQGPQATRWGSPDEAVQWEAR